MSEQRSIRVQISGCMDIICAVEFPVREDGALPYQLAEITTEVKDMFRAACETAMAYVGDADDDETDADDTEGDTTTTTTG